MHAPPPSDLTPPSPPLQGPGSCVVPQPKAWPRSQPAPASRTVSNATRRWQPRSNRRYLVVPEAEVWTSRITWDWRRWCGRRWKCSELLHRPTLRAGEMVVQAHTSKFGRTASLWPKPALASLRRRHEHLVFAVHQVRGDNTQFWMIPFTLTSHYAAWLHPVRLPSLLIIVLPPSPLPPLSASALSPRTCSSPSAPSASA